MNLFPWMARSVFGTRSDDSTLPSRTFRSIEIRYGYPFFLADAENAALQATKRFLLSRTEGSWNVELAAERENEEFSGAENTFVCQGNCSRRTFLHASTTASNVKKRKPSFSWVSYVLCKISMDGLFAIKSPTIVSVLSFPWQWKRPFGHDPWILEKKHSNGSTLQVVEPPWVSELLEAKNWTKFIEKSSEIAWSIVYLVWNNILKILMNCLVNDYRLCYSFTLVLYMLCLINRALVAVFFVINNKYAIYIVNPILKRIEKG